MSREIEDFITYMLVTKQAADNTIQSYKRDLNKMSSYMRQQGVKNVKEINSTSLMSYMLWMEKQRYANSTISRNISAIHTFFSYLIKNKYIETDPSEQLKSPQIENKSPAILTMDEVKHLLKQPDGNTVKQLRDKAMLELLYATGMQVSELLHLKVTDINIKYNYVIIRERNKERTLSFYDTVGCILVEYLQRSQRELQEENGYLFVNCRGNPMTRQGFWKLIKYYADKSGIEKKITPSVIRQSIAIHSIQKDWMKN